MDIRIDFNVRDNKARVRALTVPGMDWLRDYAYSTIYDNHEDITVDAEAAYEFHTAAVEAGLEVNGL